MLNLKKLFEKLINSTTRTLSVTTDSETIAGDWRGTKDIPITLPTGAEIVAVTITHTPNGHWFRANVGTVSDTNIGLHCHNEYSSALTGWFSILVAYKITT